jgi:NADPH-dependent 2,4-dienoyl-CoA reductase/sulfur reductase-like enzyme
LKKADLVIVGAGPGGLAAAIEAAKYGIDIIIMDENPMAGGQIYRQFNPGLRAADPNLLGRDFKRGQKLLKEFEEQDKQIEFLNDALVWGLFDKHLLTYQRQQTSASLKYKYLILAGGAYERPVPFPGWTLPGVITAGGAQTLVKTQGVLPGENILLAGTGPLQLVLADQVIKVGGKIKAILEASDLGPWLPLIKGLWGQWEYLADGWRFWRNIKKAGIPLMRRHIILEAHGGEEVEEVVIARLDKEWRPMLSTRQTLKVDTICLGFGFVSSTELTRLAKCEHLYDPVLGGWIPWRRETMETSTSGVYSVGDCAGVAGSLVAIEEGRIAGLAVAHEMGCLSDSQAGKQLKPHRSRLAKLSRFRGVLDEISRPRAGLYELADNNTVICRCEEIPLGEIKEAISAGALDINEIKRTTRIGMGRCQGRMCGPVISELLAGQPFLQGSVDSHLNVRSPVKPVALGNLATYSEKLHPST